MPTMKPRLSVTLTPESRAALERFSEVSGIAASQFIRSIVDDAVPIIDAMTRAYETARKSPARAVGIMESEFVRTMAKAAQSQLDLEVAKKEKKIRQRPRKPSRD